MKLEVVDVVELVKHRNQSIASIDVDINAPPISEIEEEVVETTVDIIEELIKESVNLNELEDGAEVDIEIEIDLNGNVEVAGGKQDLDVDIDINFPGSQCNF